MWKGRGVVYRALHARRARQSLAPTRGRKAAALPPFRSPAPLNFFLPFTPLHRPSADLHRCTVLCHPLPLSPPAPMRSLFALLFVSLVASAAEPTRALVYSRTAGFRHGDSIPLGNKMLAAQYKAAGLEVDISEDPAVFTAENLARYRSVAFMSTTGDVMTPLLAKTATPEQKAAAAKQGDVAREAFQKWMENGGSFVGIHAASDTEYKWPWFGKMIGGYFAGHPQIQPATLRPIVKDHPSTVHLPAEWKRKDEWYNFRDLQPDNVVLILLDESTYKGGKNGERHPIAWCKPVGKGRMFYTAGGHTKESFAEPEFIQHVNGGLLWTLGK